MGVTARVDGKPLPLEELFGKDAKTLATACYSIMQNWMYPYQGCYSNHPSVFEILQGIRVPEGSTFLREYKSYLEKWYEAHPAEKEKEITSRREWELQRDNHFRVAYGIARRHGLYLKWGGNNKTVRGGEHWVVYRNYQPIGQIDCW